MTEQYIILIVILVFSIVQSIFGVGLLLFGTPTFLLLGYSYSETLWLLLPCSVTISLIQVISEYNLIKEKKRVFYLVIPTLVLGLALVIIYANNINITRLVGVFLLLIGVVRFSSRLQALLSLMVKKHIQIYYIMIGIVHGVSNMGGGPLSILMSTIYSKKEAIRANVAFVYLILAIFQLAVLSILNNTSLGSEAMLLILISLASYIFTNKFISPIVNDKKYVFIFNIIVLTYGVLAIIK
jgi:uncharacterized protein|tara:strand:- start:935 stop:1654 length:720 start_codon:yes stop_codon:yes gene_type:complete